MICCTFSKDFKKMSIVYDVQIHRNDVVSGTVFNMCVVLLKYAIQLNMFSFCRILTQWQGLRSRLMLENTEGAIKMDNPEKLPLTGNIGYSRRRKTKHNILCIGHHYSQANTNYVNKT